MEYTNYQFFYLISLYLNSQLHNIALLSGGILLYKKKYSYWGIIGWLLFFFYCTLFSVLNVKITTWPISLLVGLNTIHPWLYYSGFISLTLVIFKRLSSIQQYSWPRINFILGIALLLGMYWGCANDVWGFFWVNDLIEEILLYIFGITLWQLHTYRTLNIWYCIYVYFGVIMLLIMVRLNLFSTRHSFFLEINTASYSVYLYSLLLWIFGRKLQYGSYLIVLWLLIRYLPYLYIITLMYNYWIISTYIHSNKLTFIHISIMVVGVVWLLLTAHYFLYYNFYEQSKLVKLTLITDVVVGTLYNKWLLWTFKNPLLTILYGYSVTLYMFKNILQNAINLLSYGYIFYCCWWLIFSRYIVYT